MSHSVSDLDVRCSVCGMFVKDWGRHLCGGTPTYPVTLTRRRLTRAEALDAWRRLGDYLFGEEP